MTNQEAIDSLRSLRKLAIGFVFEDSPKIVALDLATKALEREETTQWYLAEEFNTWECEECGHQAHIYGINYCPNCGRRVVNENDQPN